MKRLFVDGADITAVIPQYQNRIIHPESFEKLLERKRTSVTEVCDVVGITTKSMWRFYNRQRVLPVVTGWRITSHLGCRITDFTSQHSDAKQIAKHHTVMWESRDFTRLQLAMLVDALSDRLRGMK